MQTADKKKPKPRKPDVRSLKIQPRHRDNQDDILIVPEIKLCGNWLQKLGFTPDQRVNVTTMNKLLIIRLDE